MRLVKTLLSALVFSAFAVGPAAAAGKNPESGQKRLATGSPNYVAAPVVTAPIPRGHAFSGLLQVDSGFDIPDARLRARVQALQPRIRADMREALAYYTRAYYRSGAVPDTTRIAAQMQAAADRTIGQSGARLVLVSVMVHGAQ